MAVTFSVDIWFWKNSTFLNKLISLLSNKFSSTSGYYLNLMVLCTADLVSGWCKPYGAFVRTEREHLKMICNVWQNYYLMWTNNCTYYVEYFYIKSKILYIIWSFWKLRLKRTKKLTFHKFYKTVSILFRFKFPRHCNKTSSAQ